MLGVDGYRLDATRYMVETGPGEAGQADTEETHQLLKDLSTEVRAIRPDAILVAENTVGTARLAAYYGSTAVVRGGDEMPMNFNFPLATALLESVKSGNATRIRTTLGEMSRLYPNGIIDAPFVTNHDQTRIATVLGNQPGKLRNAAAILLTLPGMPFLYYGEEVGLQNGPTSADESKRTPMPWNPSGGFSTAKPWHPYAPGLGANNVVSQDGDKQSLLSTYRNWIAARKGSAGLLKGTITLLETDARILAFIRASQDERVLVVHNLSDSVVNADQMAEGSAHLEPIFTDASVSFTPGSTGGWRISLPPRSSGAWRTR